MRQQPVKKTSGSFLVTSPVVTLIFTLIRELCGRQNDLHGMRWPYAGWLLSVMYSRRLLLGGSRLLNGLQFKRPDPAKLVSILGTVVGEKNFPGTLIYSLFSPSLFAGTLTDTPAQPPPPPHLASPPSASHRTTTITITL